ncbi:MAG: hypothetical protein H5U32_02550 [Pseudomonas balearica]|jgi:hypothetical protein|uniref:hypothetical protein n=1 Tax=Stutzerimonas balearica TaxID=74829 RepID=UPI001998D202|nr:hypothetical protein [Stutzerimonas balearica]MBC7198108.1 hypothetical protein [Stutzerimonas balearica]
MSITQQLAHWFIALGLDPAMGALLALILLVAVPLMIGAGVVAALEAVPFHRRRSRLL